MNAAKPAVNGPTSKGNHNEVIFFFFLEMCDGDIMNTKHFFFPSSKLKFFFLCISSVLEWDCVYLRDLKMKRECVVEARSNTRLLYSSVGTGSWGRKKKETFSLDIKDLPISYQRTDSMIRSR